MIFSDSQPPRIAFVAGGIPLGGSTTFTLFLAAALRKSGVRAEVFSFIASNPLGEEFSTAGIPVHTQDENHFIYEDRLQQVYAGLRAFKPTVVFAVLGLEAFEILRYLPSRVLRIGVFHDRAIQPLVIGPRYRHALNHFVVVAAYLRDELKRLDPEFPCTYLAHGIPLPTKIAPRSQNLKDPLRLLYYGRLENASKGVRLFPEIIAALNRRKIPFTWTIHGCGPDEAFLKKALAKDMLKGQVVFSSPVGFNELQNLVRKHDVYLLASTNEGGPLTLLEAMSLGLIPVCGDIPCLIQSVITPENGFRVPRDQPNAYAEAIGRLHESRALLERVSLAARETITNHYSAEAMAQRYLSFLKLLGVPKQAAWPAQIEPKPILGVSLLSQMVQSLGVARKVRRTLKCVKSGRQ